MFDGWMIEERPVSNAHKARLKAAWAWQKGGPKPPHADLRMLEKVKGTPLVYLYRRIPDGEIFAVTLTHEGKKQLRRF